MIHGWNGNDNIFTQPSNHEEEQNGRRTEILYFRKSPNTTMENTPWCTQLSVMAFNILQHLKMDKQNVLMYSK